MSVHDIAGQVLGDLWEYGRIVLIVGVVAIAWRVLPGRSEDDRDRPEFQGGLLLSGAGIVGSFSLFSFLNADLSKILMLMQMSGVWGLSTGISFVLAVFCTALFVFQLVKRQRTDVAVSIAKSSEPPAKPLASVLRNTFVAVVVLASTSLVWLWRLSQ